MFKTWHESQKYFLAVIALIMTIITGCVAPEKPTTSSVLPQDEPADFIFTKVTSQDSLTSLASKYLQDYRKAWLIAEFNGISHVKPGQELIIPLKPFRINGLTARGYQTIPVLSYHHFSKTKREKLYVRADEFEQQMQFLADNGYRVITLEQLFEFFELGQVPKNSVVITIDDGWSDFYHVAYPILQTYGYPATLFIQTDLINNPNRKTLNWAQVREMVNNSQIEIQCHTKTHRNLAKLKRGESFKSYFKSIEKELDEARQIIRDKLGQDVQYLAYPFGGTNQIVVELVKEHGYRGAFTVERDSNPFFANNYRINRAMIYGHYGSSHMDNFAQNLISFENQSIAQVEPIDHTTVFRLSSPKQAKQYEKQGQWRTALLHWQMIRDFLRTHAKVQYEAQKNQSTSEPNKSKIALNLPAWINDDYAAQIKTAEAKIATIEQKLLNQAENHFQRGWAFYKNKNMDQAETELLRALLFNPIHQQAHTLLKTKLAGDEYKEVIVKSGDTLKKIAKREYGDSKKDFVVAHFGHVTNAELSPNILLTLPVIPRSILTQKSSSQRRTSYKPQSKTVCGINLGKRSKRSVANAYYAKGHEYFNNNQIKKAKKALGTAKCLGSQKASGLLDLL